WKAEAFRYVRCVVVQRPFTRKPNRLSAPVYEQRYVCSLTLVTAGRISAFASADWVVHCLDVLRGSAVEHRIAVLAYCFMPDHVHLLVHNTGTASVVRFVKDFKQFTGYRYKRTAGATLWQKSYHDHFLRNHEDVMSVAKYIFANPVRAGIVGTAAEYPFSGSLAWGRAVVEA
ncbi:MAG: transposase, partial [Chloroflexota bacterium]